MNTTLTKTYATIMMAALAAAAVTGALFFGVRTAESQEYATLAANPTITVTGDASMPVASDQATIIVNIQTAPDDIEDLTAQHERKVQEVTEAVQDVAGENATVTIGSQSMYPNYSGSAPASGDVTFTVQSSVQIQTDIDHLSDLVSSIADAGYGFESVYFDPYYSSRLVSTDDAQSDPVADPESPEVSNPITIGVYLNSNPGVLTEALEEYEEKYRGLVAIVEEAGLSQEQIVQNNFNIYPSFYGPSAISGYSMSTQLAIKTSRDNIESVAEAVRSVDGAYVENTFFSISDAAVDSARKELGKMAFDNARSRADEMAGSLGLVVKGVKSIETSTNNTNPNYGYSVFQHRGVNIVPPYYYQSVAGELSVTQTVVFELGTG